MDPFSDVAHDPFADVPHPSAATRLSRSQALQNAARAQSDLEDEQNTPFLDRAAHAVMGALDSIPGVSLADEVRGAANTVPDALKPLLATPLAAPLATTALAVDKLRGTGKYEAGRDVQREAQALAQADPFYDVGKGAGTLAQAALAPLTGAATAGGKGIAAIGKAALEGAKAGGLGGLLQGFGEGEGAKQSIEQALQQGAIGGVTGGALGAAGNAAGQAPVSTFNPDVGDLAARGLANAATAASKVAPVLGRGVGAVGGAAGGAHFGPVGAVVGGGSGYRAGAKVGDAVANAASKLANKVRPPIDASDLVVESADLPATPSDFLRVLADDIGPKTGSPSGLDLATRPGQAPTKAYGPTGALAALKEKMIANDGLTPKTPPQRVSDLPPGTVIDFDQSFSPADLRQQLADLGAARAQREAEAAAALAAMPRTGAMRTPRSANAAPASPASYEEMGRDLVATEHPEDFEPDPAMRARAIELLDAENAPTRKIDFGSAPAETTGERTMPEIDWRALSKAASDAPSSTSSPSDLRAKAIEMLTQDKPTSAMPNAQLGKLRIESSRAGSAPWSDLLDEHLEPVFDEFGNELPNPRIREAWREAAARHASTIEGGPTAPTSTMLDEDVAALLGRGGRTKGGLLGTSQYFGKRNADLLAQSTNAELAPSVQQSAAGLLANSRTAPVAGVDANVMRALRMMPPEMRETMLRSVGASTEPGNGPDVEKALRAALTPTASSALEQLSDFGEPSFVRKTADEMGLTGSDDPHTSTWYLREGGEDVASPSAERARIKAENAAMRADKLPGDRGAVLKQLLETNGVNDYDSAKADAAYQAYKNGGRRGPKPPALRGGSLDAFNEAGRGASSLLEAWEKATRGMKTWRELRPLLPALAEALGVDEVRLPDDVIQRQIALDAQKGS